MNRFMGRPKLDPRKFTRCFFPLGLMLLFFLAKNLLWAEEMGPDMAILEELKLFSKAVGVILEGYVDDVKPRNLLYEAVKGMLVGRNDPYTEFIDRDRYELLKISMKGEYSGIGTMLKVIEGFPVITDIQSGSAAEKAGLIIDDRILKIDGVSMKDKPITEVAGLLRGEAETALVLSILRPPQTEPFEVRIVREVIQIEAVKDVRMIGRTLGYFRIADFQENTTVQVERALEALHAKGMQALLIDLRGNAGGLLPKAVELAEKFLPSGTKIVSVDSKIPEQRKDYYSTSKMVESNYPIIILVNEASASASEIFTAAMQENQRAKIIGAKTFGKASVQSVVPLDEATAMKLTTARYVSPKGRIIDHVGIEPDEIVTNGTPGTEGWDRQTMRALDLMKDYI